MMNNKDLFDLTWLEPKSLGNFLTHHPVPPTCSQQQQQQTHQASAQFSKAKSLRNFLTHHPVLPTCSQQQTHIRNLLNSMRPKVLETFSHTNLLATTTTTTNNNNMHQESVQWGQKSWGTFLHNKHMLGIWSMWLYLLGTFSHINLFLWPAHNNNNNNNSDNNDNKHTSRIWSMRAKVLWIFLHKKTR